MAKCDLCNKIPRMGRNVSHSKKHTPRQFKPNVHPATLMVDGKRKQLRLCTRCIRTQYKLAS